MSLDGQMKKCCVKFQKQTLNSWKEVQPGQWLVSLGQKVHSLCLYLACGRRNCQWTAVVLSIAIARCHSHRHLSGQLSADCLYFPQQWYWLYPSWWQLQQCLWHFTAVIRRHPFQLICWVRDCSKNRIFGFRNRKIVVEHTAEMGVQTTQQGWHERHTVHEVSLWENWQSIT